MAEILIADDDTSSRLQLASLFIGFGYDVLTTDSIADVVEGIISNMARVVILGGRIGGKAAAEVLPILKKCKRDTKVILASEEVPLPEVRKLRKEGIFYHLLKPLTSKDTEEIHLVVKCAFGMQRRATCLGGADG